MKFFYLIIGSAIGLILGAQILAFPAPRTRVISYILVIDHSTHNVKTCEEIRWVRTGDPLLRPSIAEFGFAVEGQVNLDDLLTSRPGGIVRMKGPGMAGRLDQGAANGGKVMELLEYTEQELEKSTGWSRYSQGNDAHGLNDTVGGINGASGQRGRSSIPPAGH